MGSTLSAEGNSQEITKVIEDSKHSSIKFNDAQLDRIKKTFNEHGFYTVTINLDKLKEHIAKDFSFIREKYFGNYLIPTSKFNTDQHNMMNFIRSSIEMLSLYGLYLIKESSNNEIVVYLPKVFFNRELALDYSKFLSKSNKAEIQFQENFSDFLNIIYGNKKKNEEELRVYLNNFLVSAIYILRLQIIGGYLERGLDIQINLNYIKSILLKNTSDKNERILIDHILSHNNFPKQMKQIANIIPVDKCIDNDIIKFNIPICKSEGVMMIKENFKNNDSSSGNYDTQGNFTY